MIRFRYAKVLVHIPFDEDTFDYRIPDSLRGQIIPMQMVAVPFQHAMVQGLVLSVEESTAIPSERIRDIYLLIDPIPVLTEAQLALAKMLAARTLAPLKDCINTFLTEKIRNLSETNYRLIDTNALTIFEQLSSEHRTTRENLIAWLREAGGTLSTDEVERAADSQPWKSAMKRLIRDKVVEQFDTFQLPQNAPKTVRKAFSLPAPQDRKKKWSNVEALHRRREAILSILQETPEGMTIPESTKCTGTTLSDLKQLEKHGQITIREIESLRAPETVSVAHWTTSAFSLNTEQANALAVIQREFSAPAQKTPILIQGVTGSGKTEVYLQATSEALSREKQTLILVPEIALTPQIVARFSARFPNQVGVYHSRLSDGERYDAWRCGRDGTFRVIIGPRSAMSVPLPNLGLIVVDECHDDSYYQTENLPYFSAVQAASEYAKLTQSVFVMGSATPTVAQVFKAEKSGWHLVKLTQRASGMKPPTVQLVDMREELKAGNRSIFSQRLLIELEKTLSLGKQSILFLNRRGTASYTFCHACGHEFICPSCDIPLTYHTDGADLRCHFCGFRTALPAKCPSCHREEIRQFGMGVELVEQSIQTEFPRARVLRMDAETTARKGAHESLLTRFAHREADILIGTQMVAKGLDFPDVRLVGAILADVGVNFHDYRVDEHTFQQLLQVIGRAGRSETEGIAVLQTFQPERYSLRSVVTGDFDAFYRKEIAKRREIGYPPFTRLARIVVRDRDERKAQKRIEEIATRCQIAIRNQRRKATRMIGPAPCYFQKMGGFYRYHLILRGPDPAEIIAALGKLDARVEIDPPSVL